MTLHPMSRHIHFFKQHTKHTYLLSYCFSSVQLIFIFSAKSDRKLYSKLCIPYATCLLVKCKNVHILPVFTAVEIPASCSHILQKTHRILMQQAISLANNRVATSLKKNLEILEFHIDP